MEEGLLSLVGVSTLIGGFFLGRAILGIPQWLAHMRNWQLQMGLKPGSSPYPTPLIFLAVELKVHCVRLVRYSAVLHARAELHSWPYWDEAFELALRFVLTLAAVLLAGLLGLLGSFSLPLTLALALAMGVAAWFDPPRRLMSRYRAATENCLDGMPALLDGLVIALEAGQSLSRSLEVSLARGFRKGDELWVSAVRQSLEDMKRGLGVEPAFSRLRRVLPIPVIHRFAASCVLGETQGQSISGVLRRQATQCRREAQMALEKRALQAPVKLMAPLMICIFPCTFVVLLAPLSKALLSVGGG